MNILMVNKFLYPNGGSETYIFKLARELKRQGHQVAFFGMQDERNVVGNEVGAYTSNMDFRGGGGLSKLTYPFEIIYSRNARKQIRRLIDEFRPDAVHLNNINFQITPSILYEIKKEGIPIVWTAHDYQLICPNHMLYVPQKGEVCTRCVTGSCFPCVWNQCLHQSAVQSVIAAIEGMVYRSLNAYSLADVIVCPSRFMKEQLAHNKKIREKTVVLYNFVDRVKPVKMEKKDYVLYFGRLDKEKGVKTLLSACKSLPHVKFVIAGQGELENEIVGLDNVDFLGFQTGEALTRLIGEARFSLYPSEWYENCPFSIMESQMYFTPVLGARMGGIPELISDGEDGLLFESGNEQDLREKISYLWENRDVTDRMSQQCATMKFPTVEDYCHQILHYYKG